MEKDVFNINKNDTRIKSEQIMVISIFLALHFIFKLIMYLVKNANYTKKEAGFFFSYGHDSLVIRNKSSAQNKDL